MKTISLRPRRLALTLHVVLSVGWVGAVIAYLVLAVGALTGTDVDIVRSSFLSMEIIAWRVIVPLSIAGLASGLVMSATTEWGFLQHYWIVAKLAMTSVGTAILLSHAPRISEMARIAEKATALPIVAAGVFPQMLVIHAAGGLALLIVVATLSVFKPWGKTPWSRS